METSTEINRLRDTIIGEIKCLRHTAIPGSDYDKWLAACFDIAWHEKATRDRLEAICVRVCRISDMVLGSTGHDYGYWPEFVQKGVTDALPF